MCACPCASIGAVWFTRPASRHPPFLPRLAEASALLKKAQQCAEVAGSPLGSAHLKYHLGVLLMKKGRVADAVQLLEEALRLKERYVGPYHPQTAFVLDHLAEALHQQERQARRSHNSAGGVVDDPGRLLRRALDIRMNAYGAKSLLTATSEFHLGKHLLRPALGGRKARDSRSSTSSAAPAEAPAAAAPAAQGRGRTYLVAPAVAREGLDLLQRALHSRRQLLPQGHYLSEAVRMTLSNARRALGMPWTAGDHGPLHDQARGGRRGRSRGGGQEARPRRAPQRETPREWYPTAGSSGEPPGARNERPLPPQPASAPRTEPAHAPSARRAKPAQQLRAPPQPVHAPLPVPVPITKAASAAAAVNRFAPLVVDSDR